MKKGWFELGILGNHLSSWLFFEIFLAYDPVEMRLEWVFGGNLTNISFEVRKIIINFFLTDHIMIWEYWRLCWFSRYIIWFFQDSTWKKKSPSHQGKVLFETNNFLSEQKIFWILFERNFFFNCPFLKCQNSWLEF